MNFPLVGNNIVFRFIKRELKYYKKVQKLTSGKVPTSAKQQETKSINKTAPKKLTSPERPSEKSGSPPDQNVASSTDQQYVPSPDQKSAPSTGQKSAPREKSVSLDVSSSTVEVPSQPFTWWTIVWFVVPIVVVLLLLYFLYHFFGNFVRNFYLILTNLMFRLFSVGDYRHIYNSVRRINAHVFESDYGKV